MTKWISFIMLAFFLGSCTSVAVNGDQEAVLVMKPWLFGHGGVYDKPVSSGRQWVACNDIKNTENVS